MSKVSIINHTWAILLLFHTAASADDLVKFPTGPAAWTVTVGPSQTSSNATPTPAGRNHIVSMAVTQDTEKQRTIVTWSGGAVMEQWEIPSFNLLLLEDPAGNAFSIVKNSLGAGHFALPFVASSFSWLKKELQQEKDPIRYQDKQCLHYKGSVSRAILSGHGNDSGMSEAEAWIDCKTLLPVALDDGTGLATYSFQKDPPPPLTLPDKYQVAYTRYKGAMGILNPVVLPTH